VVNREQLADKRLKKTKDVVFKPVFKNSELYRCCIFKPNKSKPYKRWAVCRLVFIGLLPANHCLNIMQKRYIFFLLVLLSTQLRAQLFVDPNYTAEQMITSFFNGAGVTVSNVTYTGAPLSLGFFEGSQSNIGLNAGLLMTTGDVNAAVGPNDEESAGLDMGIPGTPWLDALLNYTYPSFDASVIEMDLVPSNDTLCFQYVFGSEEYLEYVNSNFNDLFAFLVDGPGLPSGDSIYVQPDTSYYYSDSCTVCVDTFLINSFQFCEWDSTQMTDSCWFVYDTLTVWCFQDPACPLGTIIYPGYWYVSPGGTNIALVPNTNLPVAINNLNQFVNTQYFIDNAGGTTVQYDAFTTTLWAKLPVTAGETYHVRLAIADAGDRIFDSGVFIGIESLDGDSLLIVEPEFVTQTGDDNEVVFQNETLWATSWSWQFGDGTVSNQKNPTHTYLQDGTYEVTLTASNWCSSESFKQTVQIGTSAANEPIKAAAFSVSPNPTTQGITRLDLENSSQARVRLYRTDGQLLMDQLMNNGDRLDLRPFGQGLYMLQVENEGNVQVKKVVYR